MAPVLEGKGTKQFSQREKQLTNRGKRENGKQRDWNYRELVRDVLFETREPVSVFYHISKHREVTVLHINYKPSLSLSSSLFVIRVNLLHPRSFMVYCYLWYFSTVEPLLSAVILYIGLICHHLFQSKVNLHVLNFGWPFNWG